MDALLLKLYWIQSWQLGVLIFVVFGSLSILGLLSCHSWISRHTHKANDLVFKFLAQRRARQNALTEALPGVLYFLVLGGAAVLIVMTFFLWTEEFWLQIALTLALAAMISFVVFMIVAMDHPLWGPVSASPEAFE